LEITLRIDKVMPRVWCTTFWDTMYTVVQKNAPTSADYNYDPV